MRFSFAVLCYNLVVGLYGLAIRIVAGWNEKAKLRVVGLRKQKQQNLNTEDNKVAQFTIWLHAASLGEFEQARPVIEELKKRHGDAIYLVITFFSASGYEPRKNYPLADRVLYLPMDSRREASNLLKQVNPNLILWVRYEYWYHFFAEAKQRGIPIYMLASSLREATIFTKWYGALHRKMAQMVAIHFALNEETIQVGKQIGVEVQKLVLTGEPRVDRVLQIAEQFAAIPDIEAFVSDSNRTIVMGSIYARELQMATSLIARTTEEGSKWIIAPHEVKDMTLQGMARSSFRDKMLTHSEWILAGDEKKKTCSILWIDNVGMLNRLYHYGALAIVGGGHGKGIHSVLEPAAFNLPVVFGPNYQKFEEANRLLQSGNARVFDNADELEAQVMELLELGKKEDLYGGSQSALQEMKGATKIILERIELLLSAKRA